MYQGQRSHTCRWYWMHTVNVTTAAHKRYTEVTNNYSAKSIWTQDIQITNGTSSILHVSPVLSIKQQKANQVKGNLHQ